MKDKFVQIPGPLPPQAIPPPPSLDAIVARLTTIAKKVHAGLKELPEPLQPEAFRFVLQTLASYQHPVAGPILLMGLAPNQILPAVGIPNVSA